MRPYKYHRKPKKKANVVISITAPVELIDQLDKLIDGIEIANRTQAVRYVLARGLKALTAEGEASVASLI